MQAPYPYVTGELNYLAEVVFCRRFCDNRIAQNTTSGTTGHYGMDSALLVGDVVDELLKAFRREPGGTWICVEPTTFEGPNGRIQVARGTAFTPGSMFMGADLAKWLDERLAKLHKPTSH